MGGKGDNLHFTDEKTGSKRERRAQSPTARGRQSWPRCSRAAAWALTRAPTPPDVTPSSSAWSAETAGFQPLRVCGDPGASEAGDLALVRPRVTITRGYNPGPDTLQPKLLSL